MDGLISRLAHNGMGLHVLFRVSVVSITVYDTVLFLFVAEVEHGKSACPLVDVCEVQ